MHACPLRPPRPLRPFRPFRPLRPSRSMALQSLDLSLTLNGSWPHGSMVPSRPMAPMASRLWTLSADFKGSQGMPALSALPAPSALSALPAPPPPPFPLHGKRFSGHLCLFSWLLCLFCGAQKHQERATAFLASLKMIELTHIFVYMCIHTYTPMLLLPSLFLCALKGFRAWG